MGAIGYYIVILVVRVLTLLPLEIFYIFSYPLFFVLYIFPGYRKKIARINLTNAFPEKSLKAIKSIERKFYLHMADLFIETVKEANLSEKTIRKRYKVTNPELPESLIASGKDVLAVGGHYNNWEWLTFAPLYMKVPTIIIYKPLENKRFDKYIFNIRSRFGVKLTPMSSVVREIIDARNKGVNTMSVFIADQNPRKRDIRYWTKFMNQDAPVYLGAEKVSAKFNMAVLYLDAKKIKRGHYELTFEELFRDTANLPEHTVTEAHVRRLEESIKDNPEFWIWTHRRWKHKKEDFKNE